MTNALDFFGTKDLFDFSFNPIKTFLGDFQYDRNLILDGLYKLYEKNRKEK